MNEQTPVVRMKGVGSRLWVTVDPAVSFATAKDELIRLFDPLKHLAHDTRVVLDTGSARENGELHQNIRAFLEKEYHLKEILPPHKKDQSEKKPLKMKQPRNMIAQHRSDTLVLSGRVRSGQTVSAKKHLVILGDANPGCELIAGGDILVIGSLMGNASAGQPKNKDAIILALDFRPLQVNIGGVVAAGLPASNPGVLEFAHLEDETIVVDDYRKANPFKRMPWPVIR